MANNPPTLADFRLRYPEFASTPDDRINYWLADAGDPGFAQFIASDQPKAIMLLAAHNLAGEAANSGDSEMPAGVTSLRSGALSLSFDADYVKASSEGGYGSTRYGRELALLTQANVGGMRVTGSGGVVGVWGGYLSGLHPSY